MNLSIRPYPSTNNLINHIATKKMSILILTFSTEVCTLTHPHSFKVNSQKMFTVSQKSDIFCVS